MHANWLIVFAAVALLAGARARPGANDIEKNAKSSDAPSKTAVAPNKVATIPNQAAVPAANAPAPAANVAAPAGNPAAPAGNQLAPAGNPVAPAGNPVAPAAVQPNQPAAEVVPDKQADVQTANQPKQVQQDSKSADLKVDPKASNKTVDLRPVNERFPHAVLFGGTCGGTIISPTWILTAGHCTLFTGGRYVLAGTNNTENESGVTRFVKRQVIHPLFTVGPYWLDADDFNIKQVAARWDFLLAELSEPLPLDGKVMVAAKLDDQPSLPAGLNVAYAGYGTDHFGGTMRSEMHGMELSVQPDDVCRKLEQYNPKDMLCVKGRPPRYDSACNGDSGSGLVDETGRLIGVASWVENDAHDCSKGALVVFSRVSSVRDWIRQVAQI